MRSYYSYSICLVFWTRRLSIQYVYERVFFFIISLVSQSGCKSRKLISKRQMFFEVFFLENFFSFFLHHIYQSLNELSVFCGVQM
ncbi:hypothetical protein BD847_0005 [Flavobacterium cutihirudinis]|uniref:Uncharacterized protein n=1 Tax=Flavobacterium cutihirudinis TaxID=1265740 RepID=A0A3D9FQL9_9FLAO|nr:hypothetical protein BD847_3390 [Flavobacterium cutihirudinis]RED27647.1 hypothetical protein BD847_0005 [Flavobacterium cutihirudinis]